MARSAGPHRAREIREHSRTPGSSAKGRRSRAGSGSENAVDWDVPEGTIICAAREGRVVGVRDDSTVSGTDPKFKREVLIKTDATNGKAELLFSFYDRPKSMASVYRKSVVFQF